MKTFRRMKSVARFAPVVAAAVAGLACGGAAPSTAAEIAAPATLRVPGTWNEQAPQLVRYDGFAWYRANLAVPADWTKGQLMLYVEKIDNASETFFNGVKIGVAGKLPPGYESGLADSEHRYIVPAEIVKPDGPNLVAIRVYDHDGNAGFKGIAPCLLGPDKQAVSMAGAWQFRLGDDPAWAREPLDDMAAFATVGPAPEIGRFATVIQRKPQDKPLSPAESLARFKVPDDLAVDIVLAEPTITQPLFLDFDSRGRLWLLEYRQYPEPAGLTLVSKDAYWRAAYDKVPLPPPHGVPGADRITIHEDTDGDGSFDVHATFLDGLSIATSFAQAHGGVYVLNPPYLLFYADADGDDRPDGDPEVLLEGFGIEDTHSVVNSLRWGPDGWLYAAQGSTVSAAVRRPGEKAVVHSQGQNVWRYHPATRTYEIFAEGGGNAFGVEFDAAGRIFSGHNGGNTRGFHYMQGSYLQKGFGKHGPLSNPFAFGYFPQMEHGDYARFTHSFLVYEGDALPDRYRGRLIAANPITNHVIVSEITPVASTFRTKDTGFAIDSEDAWFRPVDVEDGPDGAVYVADWYDGQLAHTANYQGGIDRDHGRIYRIRSRTPAAGTRMTTRVDLATASSADLVALLDHSNRWQRHEAVVQIGQRGPDPALVATLAGRLADQSRPHALETLWALAAAGGLDEHGVSAAVQHPRPEVRGWAWRLWFDHHDRVDGPLADALLVAARSEQDVGVLCQIAASTRRIASASRALELVRPVASGPGRADDPRLPLLVWWAIEAKISSDRDAVLAWLADTSLWSEPLVAKELLPRLMRRFAATGQRADLAVCAQLLALAPSAEATAALMRGFEEAYQGRSLAHVPPELLAALAAAGGGSLALKVRQGDEAALAEAVGIVADEKASSAKRVDCIRLLAEVRHAPALDLLLELVDGTRDDGVRVAALESIGSFGDARVPARVLARYPQWTADVRDVAQALLVTRRDWARALLEAVDRGDVDATTIPVETIRKATIFRDDRIAELVRRRWPNVEGSSTAEMQAELERLSAVLAAGGGDPYRGKKLYMESCGKCHVLHAIGGNVGPDLTTFKRDDVARLLVNILNPSAEIREGFETHVAVMDDGRVVQGLLVEDDPQVLVLRDSAGQTVSLERDAIEERRVLPRSLMPEGQLKPLADESVRDLFAYLRMAQPLVE